MDNAKAKEYLMKIFSVMRERDEMLIVDQQSYFTKTELRLITEVLATQAEGKQIISTQLAKRLGITRSAVSQIVCRLEEKGIIIRTPSATDKKIAYVSVSQEFMDKYGEDIDRSLSFLGNLVEKFGEDKFDTMYELFAEFIKLAKSYAKEIRKEGK